MKKMIPGLLIFSIEASAKTFQLVPSVSSPQGTMLSGLIEGNVHEEKNKRLMLGVELGSETLIASDDKTLLRESGAISLGVDASYEAPFHLWTGYRFQVGQKQLEDREYWYINQTFTLNTEDVLLGIGVTLNQTGYTFQGRSLDRLVVYPFVGLPIAW